MKLLLLFAIVSSVGSIKYNPSRVNRTLSLDEWWGAKELRPIQDTSIRPARIEFDDGMINDLRSRLLRHNTFTPPLNDAGFQYGFNSDAIYFWISYWAEKYDFKGRENYLNQFPQYKTNIQGLDIHFIWIKPQAPTNKPVLPLLLLHGWPGSIREFYEAIPLLTCVDNDRDFVVELIVPCLPGFGFSDGAIRTGFGATQVAIVLRNLMHRLGFDKFYVQGGDWGGVISSIMSTLFSEEILGFHTNWAIVLTLPAIGLQLVGATNPSIVVDAALADRMYPLEKIFSMLLEETGYFHIQATKPDTVGIALSDSPSGLLAYILEKFSTGVTSENRNLSDGGLRNTFTPEQLIDNLMMYWSSGCITTSMRMYAESSTKKHFSLGIQASLVRRDGSLSDQTLLYVLFFHYLGIPTPVPTWVIQAKNELTYQSPMILRLKYPNLLNTTVLDFGGHFFALEHPEVFADSVLTALKEFRNWHNVNEISN